MDKLSNDLWHHLFGYLPISGIRSIIRTCKCLNIHQNKMPEMESKFQKMIIETRFIGDRIYGGFYDLLTKYTIELIYDGYDIPERYVNSTNAVLFGWEKITRAVVARNDLSLIGKINNVRQHPSYMESVMRHAARLGFLDILKWGSGIVGHPNFTFVYTNAIKGNQLEVMRHLITKYRTVSFKFPSYALRKGRIDILKMFMGEDFGNPYSVQNYDSVLVYRNNIAGKKVSAFWSAIDNNDKWNLIHRIFGSQSSSLLLGIDIEATMIGDYDLLMFAHDHGYMGMYKAWYEVGDNFAIRNVKILKWLLDNHYVAIGDKLSRCVVIGGDIECLEFLHRMGYLIVDRHLFSYAAEKCDIAMMNSLLELKCPVNKSSIYAAASSFLCGHRYRKPVTSSEFWQMAMKLEEQGCTWDHVAEIAAAAGDLEMLKYIHQRGYPLTIDIINSAVDGGHLNIVIWCRKNGCVWDRSTCLASCHRIDLNMLKWLRNHNNYRAVCSLASDETEICPWDHGICEEAYSRSSLDLLKFAVENGGDYSMIPFSKDKTLFNEYLATLPPYISK